MKPDVLKAAVLISGHGSNLKALIDAVAAGRLELDIVRVVSNRNDAGGIDHAKAAGIPVSVISHTSYPDRDTHDAAVAGVLDRDQAQLIILAGYMRILSKDFTRRFSGRMINLHPSLLPLYRGLDTYNRALRSGDSETGASIHFVNAGLDAGPVIAQVRIPIGEDDDEASLSARLGPLEHKLIVATVALFCEQKVQLQANKAFHGDRVLEQPLQMKHDGRFFKPA